MNFSTVPPWSSISARIASKYLAMTFRRDSGSSCSPSCVDPVTSQKRIVTVFRTSSAGEDAGSAEPQFEQNLASAGLAAPQEEHAVMRRSLGRLDAGEKAIGLMGANIDQQYLAAGLVDEIRIYLVDVLLGGGRRLFDQLPERVDLELKGLSQTGNVTHLEYRLVR